MIVFLRISTDIPALNAPEYTKNRKKSYQI